MKRTPRPKAFLHDRHTKGFTLVELLVGALVASLTVAAGLSLSQIIVNNNKQSERNSAAIELADNAIDQMQQEIRNGEQLIDTESELPSGCNTYKQQGLQFLFAVDIPDQAMSLGSYDISSGKPDLKTIKCPIVYASKKVGNDLELYRIGTDINKSGYYDSSKTSTTLVLSDIGEKTNRSLQCPSTKWKHTKRGGIEICVDQRLKRMAKITVTLNNGRDLQGITSEGKTTQRQGSAMTEITRQEDIASSGSGGGGQSKCKIKSGCSFGGQTISCDKTSFLIDTSGSMAWNGRNYGRYNWSTGKWEGGPNSRMEKAKRELLRAIDSCSDEAEINVSFFASGRGSLFGTPQKLSAKNRALFRQKINALGAGGMTYPFQSIHGMMNDKNVREIVILSDGQSTENTYGYAILGGKRYYGEYAKSYQQHNISNRSSSQVKIKTISYGGGNYCGSGWMGRLADLNGGTCIVSQ